MPEIKFSAKIEGDEAVVSRLDKIDKKLDMISGSGKKIKNDLDRSMAEVGNRAQKTGKDFDDFEKSIKRVEGSTGNLGSTFKKLIGVLGGIQIARWFKDIATESTKMAMDVIESENLFVVSMKGMTQAALAWSKDVSKTLGLNQYEVRRNVATFNVMFNSMKLGTEQAYEMSKGLTMLAYDFASFYNLRPDEAFDKIRAGITGEMEPLKRLGIMLDDETIKTYAYKNGIAELGDELTQNEKVLARYGSLMEQTADAQGDLARTLDSPTNMLRAFRSRMDEVQASAGVAFLPTLQSSINFIDKFVKSLEGAGTSLQFFAKLFASPIYAINALGAALNRINEVGFQFMAWASKKLEWLPGIDEMTTARLEGRAKGFEENRKQYEEQMAQMEIWVQKLGEFDYNAAKSQETINQLGQAGEEKFQKMTEKLTEMVEPAKLIAKEMQTLIDGGVEVDRVLAGYAEKLVDATNKQARLGITLDETTRGLYDLAIQYKRTTIDIKDQNDKIFKELMKMTDDLLDPKKLGKAADDSLKKLEEDLKTYKEISKKVEAEIADSKNDQLIIEREMLDTTIATTAEEKRALEEQKIHIDYMIKKESVRAKYTALRAALEEKIATMNPDDPLTADAAAKVEALIEAEAKAIETLATLEGIEISKSHKREYEDMIRTVREGAGQVFDALLSDGKNAFGSLLDWLKGMFFTELRRLFQDSVSAIFQATKGGGGGVGGVGGIFGNLFGGGGEGGEGGVGGFSLDNLKNIDWSKLWGNSGKSFFNYQGGLKGGFGGGNVLGAMGGANMFIEGVQQSGVKGWAKSIGGGALTGMSIGGPIGAAIGAGVGLGAKLWQAANGKNAWEAGSMEVSRDFGGVNIDKTTYENLMKNFGWSESNLYHRRAEANRSPQALLAFYQMAQEQGKTEQFLRELNPATKKSKYGGGWGDIDFRKPFEEGLLTGDWEALNKVWYETSGLGKGLAEKFPEIAEAMKINGTSALDAAKGMMELYTSLKESSAAADEFKAYVEENRESLEKYAEESTFFAEKLGEVDQIIQNLSDHAAELSNLESATSSLEQMRQVLKSFAPSIEMSLSEMVNQGLATEGQEGAIEKALGLINVNEYFGELVAHVRETGEVLPDLIQMMNEFGGSVDAFDRAGELKGLMTSLSTIQQFKEGLSSLAGETSALEDVLNGVWNSETIQKLMLEGFDPNEFRGLTQLIDGLNNWTSAVDEFHRTGRLTAGGITDEARSIIDAAGLSAEQLANVQGVLGGSNINLTESGQTIANMLREYGGAEGVAAADLLEQGINTVSDSLLETARANMKAALEAERQDMFSYLETTETGLRDRASEIQSVMEAEFSIVSGNIAAAFMEAREEAIESIDAIIEKIKEMNETLIFGGVGSSPFTTEAPTGTTSPNPLTGTIDPNSWIGQIIGNIVGGIRTSSSTASQTVSTTPTIVNYFTGNNYGSDDLDNLVNEAWIKAFQSGAYRGILS